MDLIIKAKRLFDILTEYVYNYFERGIIYEIYYKKKY